MEETSMTKLWVAILCAFATATLADTLTLRDGKTVQGDYAGGDTRTVRMMVGDSVQTFRLGDVVSLTFGPAAPVAQTAPPPQAAPPVQPAAPVQAAPPTQAAPPVQPAPPTQAAPPVQPAPPAAAPHPPDQSGLQHDRPNAQSNPAIAGVEIPAGTKIVIRMIDPVDSETDQVGNTFRASVDEPVNVKGQAVIPRDSDVLVKLVEQRHSGKLTGTTALTLALQQVQINGKMVDTYTERVTKASGSRGKRTAGAAGGGAAVGAVIGGIAGGGAGAAIGAVAGGAVGTGVEVMTSGEKVKIPSETRLTFTLESAVQL
jgi:hypothetical protein